MEFATLTAICVSQTVLVLLQHNGSMGLSPLSGPFSGPSENLSMDQFTTSASHPVDHQLSVSHPVDHQLSASHPVEPAAESRPSPPSHSELGKCFYSHTGQITAPVYGTSLALFCFEIFY
jgi:hypothetical protein